MLGAPMCAPVYGQMHRAAGRHVGLPLQGITDYGAFCTCNANCQFALLSPIRICRLTFIEESVDSATAVAILLCRHRRHLLKDLDPPCLYQ